MWSKVVGRRRENYTIGNGGCRVSSCNPSSSEIVKCDFCCFNFHAVSDHLILLKKKLNSVFTNTYLWIFRGTRQHMNFFIFVIFLIQTKTEIINIMYFQTSII